ncbi:MAG: protein TolR [Oceanococcus sp.]
MIQAKKRRLAHEINVVPYIDVMLVLLVIFMITAPLLTQGVEVNLPDAAAETMEYDEDNEPIVLSVDAKGQYFLNRGSDPKAAISDEEIQRIVSSILKHKPKTAVVVEGDEKVEYARVMHAMSLLQQAGVQQLGFATESPE